MRSLAFTYGRLNRGARIVNSTTTRVMIQLGLTLGLAAIAALTADAIPANPSPAAQVRSGYSSTAVQ